MRLSIFLYVYWHLSFSAVNCLFRSFTNFFEVVSFSYCPVVVLYKFWIFTPWWFYVWENIFCQSKPVFELCWWCLFILKQESALLCVLFFCALFTEFFLSQGCKDNFMFFPRSIKFDYLHFSLYQSLWCEIHM